VSDGEKSDGEKTRSVRYHIISGRFSERRSHRPGLGSQALAPVAGSSIFLVTVDDRAAATRRPGFLRGAPRTPPRAAMSLACFRAAVAARARAPRGVRDRPPRAVGHRASARAWRTGPRASARPGPESLRKGRRHHRPLGEPPPPRAAAIPTPGALASRATASARGTTAPRLRLSRDRLRAVSRASESSSESSSPSSANDAASRGGDDAGPRAAAAKAAAKAAEPPPSAPPARPSSSSSSSSSDFVLAVDVATQVKPGVVDLTEAQRVTLDAFWRHEGVASASHRASLVRAASTRGLFRDPARLSARMDELEDSLWRAVGVADLDTGVVVGRFPKVLYFEPEFLVERVRLLRDLLPAVNLRRVIERNPQVLTMDMTCTLPAKMRELSVLLPRTDVIHLIETHPKILSTNVGRGVSANVAALKRLMRDVGVVEEAVEIMVAHNPRLLSSDVEGTVTSRLRALERAEAGTVARYAEKPASLARMLCASAKAVNRLRFLREVKPEVRTSAIVAVNAPRAKFDAAHPEFETWWEENKRRLEEEEG
jgi:hypothetical protein